MKTNNIYLRILLGAGIILLAVLSALPMLPPRAVSADAPADRFSAGRAMADLQVVASKPHGAGTDAQDRVRAYIVEQVEALGLTAELEGKRGVTNILVRLPGTASTGMVLVTGHYDSNLITPGAGDDGLSTVAMLEAIRVFKAASSMRNDVLFLFTDGEELGWLGALAFMGAHPQAKDEAGALLCFDGRPGNGPLALWETSPGDSWIVRQATGLALPLYAGSWTNRAERGELDTDCSVLFKAGFTGVEIENAEAGTRYHTTRDTVDAISPGLVQAFGKTMVNLTGHFASIDLQSRSTSSDLAYFTLPFAGLVAYPNWLMPIFSSLGLLALLAFTFFAWQRHLFSFGRFGLSLLGLLLGILLIVLCAQLAWAAIKAVHAAELAATGYGFESSTASMVWLMLAAVILMTVLLVILSRRLGGLNLIPAAVVIYLLVWILVYMLMDSDNPLSTAYFVLPMLGGIAGMGVLLHVKDPVYRTILLVISAFLILVLTVPQLWLGAYTREDAWIPVLATSVSFALFAPQIDAIFFANPPSWFE